MLSLVLNQNDLKIGLHLFGLVVDKLLYRISARQSCTGPCFFSVKGYYVNYLIDVYNGNKCFITVIVHFGGCDFKH